MTVESESKNELVRDEIIKFISSRFNLDEFGFLVVVVCEDEVGGTCITPTTTINGPYVSKMLRKIADIHEANGDKFSENLGEAVTKQ